MGRIIRGLGGIVSFSLLFGASPGGTNQAQPLFVVERSVNANTVHYDANVLPNGDLDPRDPVAAYWVMSAADGRREPLNTIERRHAYGFSIEPANSGCYRLQLAAQPQRMIDVCREGGSVRAETNIAGRPAYLQRIYVSTRTVLGFPSVRYIQLFGIDPSTGKEVTEKATGNGEEAGL